MTNITCIKVLENIMAVTGGNRIKFYDINKNFVPIDECCSEENNPLLTVDLSIIHEEDDIPYAAFSGKIPAIYVFPVYSDNKQSYGIPLIGHKNTIFQLKFKKGNPKILLSCSKDHTVRLWNISMLDQICIFAGEGSSLEDVRSIDWHESEEYFISGGLDHTIRIFQITKNIKKYIKYSLYGNKIQTLLKSDPIFTSNKIHKTAIECVKFNGNFVLSMSNDGIIKEWLPHFGDNGFLWYSIINVYICNNPGEHFGINFYLDSYIGLILLASNGGIAYAFNLFEDTMENRKMEDSSNIKIEEEKKKDENKEINFPSLHKPIGEFEFMNQGFIKSIEIDRIRKEIYFAVKGKIKIVKFRCVYEDN